MRRVLFLCPATCARPLETFNLILSPLPKKEGKKRARYEIPTVPTVTLHSMTRHSLISLILKALRLLFSLDSMPAMPRCTFVWRFPRNLAPPTAREK